MIIAPSGVPADHPDHYQNMAVTLCKENADYFDVDQYDNPNNPEAYYRTLGPEVSHCLLPSLWPCITASSAFDSAAMCLLLPHLCTHSGPCC